MATNQSEKGSIPQAAVSLTSPLGGDKFVTGSAIRFAAHGSGYRMAGLQIRTTDHRVLAEKSYSGSWPPNDLWIDELVNLNTLGTYHIFARAWEEGGVPANTEPITFQIHGGSDAPTGISILEPEAGAVFPPATRINLKVSLSVPESAYVEAVEYYRGETRIAAPSSAPYEAGWYAQPEGTHEIKAKMTLRSGEEVWSAPVIIHVGDVATGITLISPVNDAQFTEPATVPMKAQLIRGALNAAQVNYVRFFNGSTRLDDVSTPEPDGTYAYNWENVPAGEYSSLRAVAILHEGEPLRSQNVNIRVWGGGSPTGIEMSSPTEGQEFEAPATVPLKVRLIGGTQGIDFVRFLNGGTKIVDVYDAPYEHDWSRSRGSYSVRAIAFLTDGSRLPSDTVNFRVL